MHNLQIYSVTDPLCQYKLMLNQIYNCTFFEHDTNGTIDIGCGLQQLDMYHEKIITDGTILLNNKNSYKPKMIWNNELITLDKGLSISINISNSTYFVNIISKNNETLYEIHLLNETQEQIHDIINYLYNDRYGYDTNSISLIYPDTAKLVSHIGNNRYEGLYSYSNKKQVLTKKR